MNRREFFAVSAAAAMGTALPKSDSFTWDITKTTDSRVTARAITYQNRGYYLLLSEWNYKTGEYKKYDPPIKVYYA